MGFAKDSTYPTSFTRPQRLSRKLGLFRYRSDVKTAKLHWVLDVHFSEDSNRARKDNAPENLAILRKLALNILQAIPDKASIRRKIKRAGWNDAFLLQAISHMR
jgi:hypothetical protein